MSCLIIALCIATAPAELDITETWERQQAVKAAFVHAWNGYRTGGLGGDELLPASGRTVDNWGGFGQTLVDSLDTLWLMDLKEDFDVAHEWVKHHLNYEKNHDVNTFETTIRHLGGLLSAYHLSGREEFLTQAKDLGSRLIKAFGSGDENLPYSDVNLADGRATFKAGSGAISEVSSLSLEFKTLAFLTAECQYFDVVDRIVDWMQKVRGVNSGLYPQSVERGGSGLFGMLTLGARADSTYEYLLKEWILTRKADPRLHEMYTTSRDGIASILWQTSSPSGYHYIAEADQHGNLHHKMDHLVCFYAGVLALEYISDFDRDADRNELSLNRASALTETCFHMYNRTASGLAPEIVRFEQDRDMVDDHASMHSLLRPETVESLFLMWRATHDDTYREWGWKIFVAFQTHCRTKHGFSGASNVQSVPVQQTDSMPSFFMAETLKYLYLLFSDDSLISLDDWVFNTEAHPLRLLPPISEFNCSASSAQFTVDQSSEL